MIDDPRGAFPCPLSTLIVLANSDPFHGLLLTVLGSQSDFHGYETPRCTYVSFIKISVWADSGPFFGVLLSFGSRSDFYD